MSDPSFAPVAPTTTTTQGDPSFAPAASTITTTQRDPSVPSGTPQSANDMVNNLLAGGYSGFNELAFGFPDLALKAANSENYAKLKAFEQAHPDATSIGGLVGDIGSFLIPGGAIARGAGIASKWAKAPGLAEKFANLARVASGEAGAGGFARGAAQAAEQAIPRAAVATAQNPNDIPGNLTEAGLSTLGGGVIGKGLEKASGLLRGLKSGFGHRMTNEYLSGIGVSGDDIASHLAYSGKSEGHINKDIEPAKLDLAQYAHSNGITNDETLKQYFQDSAKKLAPVAEKWNSDPPPSTNIWQRAIRDPEVAALHSQGAIPPDSMIAITQAITDPNDIQKMGNYWDVNDALNRMYSDANRAYVASAAGGVGAIQEARNSLNLVNAFRNAVKDEAFSRAPEDAQNLRKNWMNHLILQDASIRNSKKMEGVGTNASAAGLSGLSNPGLGRAALGAVAGGTVGSQVTPPDNRLAGTALGAAAGAFAPNAWQKFISPLATKLTGNLLPKGIGEPFTGNVPDATGRLAKIMGNGLPKVPAIAVGQMGGGAGQPPPPVAQGPGQTPPPPPQNGSGIDQSLPLGVHASQAPIQIGGNRVDVHGPINIPGGLTGVAGNRIIDNLNRMYNLYHPSENGKPLSQQEFFDRVSALTNGFDPLNHGTINILTNDPAERAALSSAMPRLSTLTDPNRINLDKLVDPIAGNNPLDVTGRRSNDNFVTMLAELNNRDPNKQPDAKDIQLAQNTINQIRNDFGLSAEQKKSMLINLLKDRGFPLANLEALGLTRGTQLEGMQ